MAGYPQNHSTLGSSFVLLPFILVARRKSAKFTFTLKSQVSIQTQTQIRMAYVLTMLIPILGRLALTMPKSSLTLGRYLDDIVAIRLVYVFYYLAIGTLVFRVGTCFSLGYLNSAPQLLNLLS